MWTLVRWVVCVLVALLGLTALAYNAGLVYCQRVKGTAKEQSYVFVVPTVACVVVGFLFPALRPWVYLPIGLEVLFMALAHRNGAA